MRVGRNEPCPCGSGLKYKNCHLRAAEPVVSHERLWQRLHEVSMQLATDLLRFAKNRYGAAVIDEAWSEFTLFREDTFDPDSLQIPAFMPWFFYQWTPDPKETTVQAKEVSGFPVGAAYLNRRGRYEDPLVARYLEACLNSAFSFLEVLTVSPGTGFAARDSLTGREATIVEKSASRTVRTGDILFAKLVSLDGLSILDGCAPIAFPPTEKAEIIELRKRIHEANPAVSMAVLKDYDLEMLAIYHPVADRLLNPRPPVLQNTDGEPLKFCRVTYEVGSAREAFEALRHLSLDLSEEDLLGQATLDEEGGLLSAEIPWLKEGNAKMAWQKTSLGHIRIEEKRLVAEVNSERRADRFRAIADAHLPPGSRHLSTVVESVEEALESYRREKADGAAPDDEDLNELPEARALLAEQLRVHYRAWPNMPLPILKGKTPLQAVKTPEGREMVEALLLDFERRSGRAPGLDPQILAELRATFAAAPPHG